MILSPGLRVLIWIPETGERTYFIGMTLEPEGINFSKVSAGFFVSNEVGSKGGRSSSTFSEEVSSKGSSWLSSLSFDRSKIV